MTTTKTNANITAATNNMTNDTQTQAPTSVVVITGAALETPIEFRQDKFAKRVDAEFATQLIPIVEEFIQKPRRNALGQLWQLLYNPQKYMSRIGLTMVNVDDPAISEEERESAKDLLFIQPELWSHFWNELRFQYAKYNIGFPDVDVPEKCAEAYKALNDATVKNHVLCAIVLDHCKTLVKSNLDQVLAYGDLKAAERAIYLMKSSKDNNVFGGVCSLSFNKSEAELLKRYAPKISQLLQAILDEKIERCGVEEAPAATETAEETSTSKAVAEVVSEEDNFNKPFAGLADKLKEKGFVLSEASAAEGIPSDQEALPASADTDDVKVREDDMSDLPEVDLIPNNLTIDVIQNNQEAISNFLTAYQQLEELGIDPAEVIAKSDTILKAFEVLKAFG